LFPHDREKEIETEKGLEGRERERSFTSHPNRKRWWFIQLVVQIWVVKERGSLKKRGEGWEEV